MSGVYSVCLIVGGAYAIISLLFGSILDGLDFDFEFNFGAFSLPLKPVSIMAFLAVFGGVGLISLRSLAPALSLIPSAASGAVASCLLYYLFYVKLRTYETGTPSEADSFMCKADVVERIPTGGYGKISYVIDGNILSGAAKEYKPGNGIEKGRRVYIMDTIDNVYYVCEDLEIYLNDN